MDHPQTHAFQRARPVFAAPVPEPVPLRLVPEWQIDPPRPVRRPGAWLEAAMDASARVMTPQGPRPAGTLVPGTTVLTLDAGVQTVLHVWRHRLHLAQADCWPQAQCVAISPGALGTAAPRRRLLVSPLAGLSLSGLASANPCDPMARTAVAPVAPTDGIAKAIDLCGRPGIGQMAHPITYVQILLGRHALIAAEGLLLESLHPARLGHDPWDAAQRAEADALWPDLAHDPWLYGPEAQPRLRRA